MPQPNQAKICRECGTELSGPATECWLCHAPLPTEPGSPFAQAEPAQASAGHDEATANAPVVAASKEPHPAGASGKMYQFHLATLMLIVTGTAVLLATYRIAVGLGLVLTVLVVPPLIRTIVVTARAKGRGQPMSSEMKVQCFAATFAIFVLVLLAAGIAFYATCWVGFFGGMGVGELSGARGYDSLGWGLVAGVLLGAVVGLYVAWRLLRRFWPRYP